MTRCKEMKSKLYGRGRVPLVNRCGMRERPMKTGGTQLRIFINKLFFFDNTARREGR